MSPPTKHRQYELLRRALAMVEERGSVPLTEIATAVEVTPAELRTLLDPVLFLEYYTADGTHVGEERAFLLTEQGFLKVDERHWLRDLETEPPSPDAALRLLIAGEIVRALGLDGSSELEDALKKLRGVVAMALRLDIEQPPCLWVVHDAWLNGQSVRFRYVSDVTGQPRAHEVLPYRVFCKWGHWYLQGRPVGPGRMAYFFRVDRMVEASPGDKRFDPPVVDELPDWFDLSAYERTVRVRVRPEALDAVPRPCRLGEPRDLGDGRVEVDVTVAGERRLDHLLVCLPADAEVVSPEEYKARRRDYARSLLNLY